MANAPSNKSVTFCNPEYVKGYLIYPFMASAHDDHSFYPLPTKNISTVVKLIDSWPEHLNVIHLTRCHPELVKDYSISPFIANVP